MERRLSAIFAADVAGYSRLMAATPRGCPGLTEHRPRLTLFNERPPLFGVYCKCYQLTGLALAGQANFSDLPRILTQANLGSMLWPHLSQEKFS
jgi:hypothetical protein